MDSRTHDPKTSKDAAKAFTKPKRVSHAQAILKAIEENGAMGADGISRKTGLTVVQIDRRLPELAEDGHLEVQKLMGLEVVHNGYRVWQLTPDLAITGEN